MTAIIVAFAVAYVVVAAVGAWAFTAFHFDLLDAMQRDR